MSHAAPMQWLAPEGPEQLLVRSGSMPQPGAGEVLIAVHAAGVNRPDLLQRAGRYPPPPGASEVLGLEVAGLVVAVGGDVRWPVPGEPVCALLAGGGYANYALAPAVTCLPVPEGLSLVQAAALPETMFTVWSMVWMRAAMQPGESLLVQGGASGIGTTAIQMARALGHPVWATAGTPDKVAACERLGAQGIDYRQQDFVAVIHAATHGRGVDVILDMVGGSYIPRELKALADDGRIALIAVQGGARSEIHLGELLTRRLTLCGATLRPRSLAFKGEVARQLRQHVWPHLASGAITPVIHAVLPWTEAVKAHRMLETGESIGKVVLQMDRPAPHA